MDLALHFDDKAQTEALAAMRAARVFSVLSEAARREIVNAGSKIALERGELLCRTGDGADAAYVVVAGELEIRTVGLDGRELRFTAFTSGALVGEMAALDGGARSADMAAARRTTLWRIPRAALLRALESDPRAALAVIGELSQRLRLLNRQLEQIARLDLGGRLAILLLAERNRNGLVAMTQTEMARRLGFSREKVNRKLHAWAADGWIEVSAMGVVVRQASRLEAFTHAG